MSRNFTYGHGIHSDTGNWNFAMYRRLGGHTSDEWSHQSSNYPNSLRPNNEDYINYENRVLLTAAGAGSDISSLSSSDSMITTSTGSSTAHEFGGYGRLTNRITRSASMKANEKRKELASMIKIEKKRKREIDAMAKSVKSMKM